MYKEAPDLTSSPRLPTNTSTQPHTNRVGALISSHPGDEVTPVGPGGHPQHTGAWFARKAVDGPQPNNCAYVSVSEKTPSLTSIVTEPQFDHSNNHNTGDTTGNDPRTAPSCPVRRSADGVHVGRRHRRPDGKTQVTRRRSPKTVMNHKQYDSESRCLTQLTVSRPCRSPLSNPGGD